MQDSEDNHYSSRGFRNKKLSFSVLLSFFVAVFAIISLIAAGFSQISYAAPTGNTLVFYEATYNYGDPILINGSGSQGTFTVPIYLANSYEITSNDAIPIFCVEHNADITDRANYTKGDNVTDLGLLYILNKSKALGGTGIVPDSFNYTTTVNTDDAKARMVLETYATQVAIWVYMYEKYYLADPSGNSRYSLANYGQNENPTTNYNRIKAVNTLSVTDYTPVTSDLGVGNDFYNNVIAPVITAAKSYTSVKNLKVNKANNTISKVGDDTYYQSSLLSVSAVPANDLVSYDVTLSGVGSAFIVDENGVEKSTGFLPGEKFYVRVPTKDISQEAGKVTVNVKGKFNNYLSGNFYTSNQLQKIVTVTGNQNYESASLIIDFVGSPDTGMSKGQTIFFIGLVVLLCGVGIIYANAKPVEIES